MDVFRSQTTSEQVAAHLRGDLMCGKLSGVMPGVLRLHGNGVSGNGVSGNGVRVQILTK